MRPGRELDSFISKEVLGYEIKVKQKQLWEAHPMGDRPLRRYSRDMNDAMEVVEKINVTLIPVDEGNWFAFAGGEERWKSPAAFLKFLAEGDFLKQGAAVSKDPAEAVCLAAMKAIEKRRAIESGLSGSDESEPQTVNA